ncbi:MAG TPA: autotransporter domain-containing protein [Roseiarcus sp.]|jgi:outer membrane autotransporter protein
MLGRIVSRFGLAPRLRAETGAARRKGLSSSTSHLALIALLGGGASSFALSAFAETINVDTQAELASAISNATGIETTIALTSDITLTSPLPSVPANVTIDAGEYRLSGVELTKSGPADLTLSGINTFKGASITGGTLRFTDGASLGSAASDIIVNGGSVGSSIATPSPIAIDRSLLLTGKGGGIDVLANPITWSGSIAGSGQFVKSGLGTLQLTGVNTYSGGTKITAGTLFVQSDAVLGKAGAPVLMSGGTLEFVMDDDTKDDIVSSRPLVLTGANSSVLVDAHIQEPRFFTVTLNGPVTGGTLNKLGPATLILNGANTYSKTNIYAGELQGSANAIKGDVTFFGPSVLHFVDTKAADTFAGSITGPGSVVKSGLAGITLSGRNSYTGGTTVNDGRLYGTSDSLQGQITNNWEVSFRQNFDGTYSGDMTGSGDLYKQGSGNLTTTGRIELGDGGKRGNVLVFDGRLTVDGSVIGKLVSTTGGGSALIVNGSVTSGGIEIGPLASLGGSGRIVGNVDNKGGQIEPGNSIGTLHIFGPLEIEPHSEYQVQINGASSDQIQVSETATIESSTFEIERYNTGASPVVPGKTYTILTTGGGLTVEEPTLAIADFPFINFTLSEDAFNGYLTTSRSAERFAELASTPNEAAVANALDSATSTLAWRQVVGASTADARAAFASLSNASIHASAAGVLSEQSHFLRDAVLERLRQDFPASDALAPADSVLTYSANAPAAGAATLPTKKAPAVAPLGPVYAVWAQGLGSWGSLQGNNNVGRTDDSIGGIISGVDVTYNRALRLGFAGGYTRSNFNSTTAAASGSADSYHMALYGGWQNGAWALRGGGSFTWNDIDTSRQVTVVGLGGQQNGSYADKTWQVFGEAARSFAFGAAALEPFANLAYVHIEGGVDESGLAAMSGSTTFDTTYTTLGAHGAYALPGAFTARATLGWQHAFGDLSPITTLAFAPGAAFGLAGSPIARDALVTELGLDYAIGPTASIGLTYAGQYSGSASENSAKANFTLRF